jgi:hypothetical protein
MRPRHRLNLASSPWIPDRKFFAKLTSRVLVPSFFAFGSSSPGPQPRDGVFRPPDPGGIQRPAIKLCRKVQHAQAVREETNAEKVGTRRESSSFPVWPRTVASSGRVFAPEQCQSGATRRNFAHKELRLLDGLAQKGVAVARAMLHRAHGDSRAAIQWPGGGVACFYCRFGLRRHAAH